ncbi:MAG: hypothetical protein LN409_02375 [Candidatus Thermoplasmatota archaeon]|nr:hypothetical protein [Candidatus Thermoplasmatota archaeon]
MAAIISFLLTVFMLAMNRGQVLALRASSLLASLAVVGPLLYIHRLLSWPLGSDLSDLSPAIGEMAIGWFIALLSGSAACVLALYLYHEVCESSGIDCDSREHPPVKSYGTPLSFASIFIVTFGAVTTVTGFFLTWNSGSASTIMGQDSWSNNGFEVSPLMYLVPVAGVVSCALLILSLFVRKTRSPVLFLATQNLLIVTLALTLFWGVAFGEFRFIGVGMVFAAKLSLGWYLCVIGLSIMLVSLFLHQRFRSTASGSRKIWRSNSTSR